jgi:PPOX class probable F420-dependent enzyme
VLATVRADGAPHAVPVWFWVDDDDSILFMTGRQTLKGRNLARTGRAALVVDDDQPPFSFVSLEGPVELVEVDPDTLYDWATRIAGRYMGAERAPLYGRRNAVEGEGLWRLVPERVTGAEDLAD